MTETELVQRADERVTERLRNMTKFKLGEAALLVGKSPPTLSRAVKAGKLSVTKDEQGDRLYDASELVRVYGALNYDALVQGADDSPDSELVRSRSSGVKRTSAAESADKDDLPVKVLLQEQKIKHQQDIISRLERDVEDKREEVEAWKEQAAASTRLLTDERDRHQQKEAESAAALEEASQPQPRSRLALVATLATVLIGAGAVAAYLYPDQLRELLAGQGSNAPEAVALTAEPIAPSPTPAVPDVTPR